MQRTLRLFVFGVAVALVAAAQEKVDLDTIYKIKQEALQNSKVMEHMFWLADAYGPRLAGAPNFKKAADWAVKSLQDWGLADAHLESWKFGRSWVNQRFTANLVEPSYQPLYGFALTWSQSTPGVLIDEPVVAVIQSEAEMASWKGKLKGKIVFTQTPRPPELIEKPMSTRLTAQELADLEMAPEPGQFGMFGGPPRAGAPGAPPSARMAAMRQERELRQKINAFFHEEGAAALVSYGSRNDGGTITADRGGPYDTKQPLPPAMVVLTPEHYNRIVRLLEHKVPVKMELEVKNATSDDEADCYNVIANIPGAGPHKDEVVMVGGHLDSWQGGTGATDNGVGSAVMLEVIRVLKAIKLPLDRTVRIGLWGGEEEGLLGSHEYVKKTFADPAKMETTPEWDKFSAYYNVDNGSGKIRGVYLQGNEMARPFFEAMLAPFKDLGVSAITIRNTGGTDHQSFDAVGLPGFQFIQDPLEYGTRTHHSNMDVYDHVSRGDLMQMSVVVSSIVYHTANREQKLPRKPKPAPRPPSPMF
jgi:hypothetical protein